MSKPAPIQGRASVTHDSPKPHVSESIWTVDKETKSASTTYLGGKLTVSRAENGILQAAYEREFTEEEGATKPGPVSMHFSMAHLQTVLEAKDFAEQNVRDNLSRIYPEVLANEDAKLKDARVSAAGDEPF